MPRQTSFLAALVIASGTADATFPCASVEECLKTPMYMIPGPNPIVAPAPDGWSSKECEMAGGVFQDEKNGEYMMVYHCLNDTESYNIGISTAKHPLGPWSPPAANPVLTTSPGSWDSDSVASMNIMRNPEPGHHASEEWLGWYEGGTGPGSDGVWTLGMATAPSAMGPWTKYAGNPIMKGTVTCDSSRQFHGDPKDPRQFCNGLYVGSVLHDPVYTKGEYWLYVEAPINMNDEGPLSLWTAKKPQGPFKFKSYVLDGAHDVKPYSGDEKWDAGRYSESRVWHHDGLFHIMATGSPSGTNVGPNPDKIHEQIGWAISKDGVNFTEVSWNPVVSWEEQQPHTIAMAEGHVWFDDANKLVIVFHTQRWDRPNAPPPISPPYPKDPFAPDGRNAEDLGLSILSPSATFAFDMPLITPAWKLDLAPGKVSPCSYDWKNYRYCAPLKTIIKGAAPDDKPLPNLTPDISFKVSGSGCASAVSIQVHAFDAKGVSKKLLQELPVHGSCSKDKKSYTGTTDAAAFGHKYGVPATFVVANIKTGKSSQTTLSDVTLVAHYSSTEANAMDRQAFV